MRTRQRIQDRARQFAATLACTSACLLAGACGHGVVFLEPEGSAENITAVIVTLNPAQVTTQQQTQALASVQGTGSYSSSVVWSVSPAAIGTITDLGLFTPAEAGTATITATSMANPKIYGSAKLTIYQPGSGSNAEPLELFPK
jgi:putative heme degradation protein